MEINLPNYDEKWIHYGISFGLHSSTYKLKYSSDFTNPTDTVMSKFHSANPVNFAGFSLGLLINLRISDNFDLRVTPKVNFYENYVEFVYTDGTKKSKVIDPTMVEFPILLKYKSSRRGNIRMYVIGGINPAIEATGKKSQESDFEKLHTRGNNLMAEFGFGTDLYFPLFKFSPEVRFSKGLIPVNRQGGSVFDQAIKSLYTNSVTFYLHFE